MSFCRSIAEDWCWWREIDHLNMYYQCRCGIGRHAFGSLRFYMSTFSHVSCLMSHACAFVVLVLRCLMTWASVAVAVRIHSRKLISMARNWRYDFSRYSYMYQCFTDRSVLAHFLIKSDFVCAAKAKDAEAGLLNSSTFSERNSDPFLVTLT